MGESMKRLHRIFDGADVCWATFIRHLRTQPAELLQSSYVRLRLDQNMPQGP